jgi:hypothetical protein
MTLTHIVQDPDKFVDPEPFHTLCGISVHPPKKVERYQGEPRQKKCLECVDATQAGDCSSLIDLTVPARD